MGLSMGNSIYDFHEDILLEMSRAQREAIVAQFKHICDKIDAYVENGEDDLAE